ncbi:MAG: tRNA dihydrouridine synthase DusB [Bacteroidales bacterium]|nr:tRNA dihydrouridine synthase DusB [Bacteroidales bacterium]
MVKIGNLEISEFPILLAPMEDVSDPPFRYLCKIFGADITYTEFISSEGLIRDAIKSLKKLEFSESERPIGVQIFGHNVESMVKAAEYAERAKPDIIDINWGCPVKKVIAKGAGAGMLRDIPKMVAITSEVVKSTHLPVTVKTRLGWDENSKNIVEVAEKLQDVGIKAISIHARTKVQGYKGKADWTLIGEVKKNPRMKIPVFGNGDILSPEIAKHFKETYNVDGLMIGRGSYGNPWIFKQIKHYLNTGEILPQPDINERVNICKKHLEKSIEWKGDRRGIFEMRKHYRSYFKGYPNFKQFRVKLVTTESMDELYSVFDEILKWVNG